MATNQKLAGLIYIVSNSSISLTLKTNSVFTGRVNTANIASSAKVTIDSSSKWTLTGNTYLTSLTDADATYSNITVGTYNLFVGGAKLL